MATQTRPEPSQEKNHSPFRLYAPASVADGRPVPSREADRIVRRPWELNHGWNQRLHSRIILKDRIWSVLQDQRPPGWQHFRLWRPPAGLKKAA